MKKDRFLTAFSTKEKMRKLCRISIGKSEKKRIIGDR
jgi:hypothetical protein